MNEEGFRAFLKKGGRSASAIDRCLAGARDFEGYLQAHYPGTGLAEAGPEELDAFVAWLEREPKTSAKTHLWALSYYYAYAGNEQMRGLARALRQQRIKRTPFPLAKLRGVDPGQVEALAAAGVKNVSQMLKAGRTPDARQELAARTGLPKEAILELVKLSDLARIPGMKGIRTRLYYDAGVDSIEELAGWEPEELREMLSRFVAETGFEGIAPLPKEVAFSVATARRLPRVVEY